MRMGVEEVTELAMEYLRKAGHTWRRVDQVIPDESNHVWRVTSNVGLTINVFKTVTIDDRNGKIIGLE